MRTKISQSLLLSARVILLTVASCKKITVPASNATTAENTEMQNGIGPTTAVNGYLYASQLFYSVNSVNCNFYAAFSDPARTLLKNYGHQQDNIVSFSSSPNNGNIDVGLVKYGNVINLNKSSFNPFCMYSMNSVSTVFSPSWYIEGNKSFKAFDIFIQRGYPVTTTITTQTIYKSSTNVIDLSGFSNYDSLVVILTEGGTTFPTIRRAYTTQTNSFVISPSDVSGFFTNTAYLYLYAFNYSHQTINNKKYIFELASKRSHYMSLQP